MTIVNQIVHTDRYAKYKTVDIDEPGHLFHYLPRVAGNAITWGEPAQICQAKMDKECPICENTRQSEMPFELITEENEITGAYCPKCGWSF